MTEVWPAHVGIEDESSPLGKYRIVQNQRLEDKSKQSELKRDEIREKARAELDQFYKTRAEKTQKAILENKTKEREFIEARDLVLEGKSSNPWEGVVSLVDIKETPGKDISRMRKILLEVKNTKN